MLQYLTNKYLSNTPANNPPVAVDDNETTNEDSELAINALNNDTDSDGTINGVTKLNGNVVVVGQIVTLVSGAEISLLANGNINYDPNGQFEDLNDGESDTDTFTYTIEDDDDAEANATVTITINGVTDGIPTVNPVTTNLITAFESEGITTSGSDISVWSDTSGSTDNYDLDTVFGNPQFVNAGSPSGKDIVSFDGVDDFLRIAGTTEIVNLPDGNSPRTLYFVVNYKTAGNFTGFSYGDNQTNQAFGLVATTDEFLAIEGWASGTRVSKS